MERIKNENNLILCLPPPYISKILRDRKKKPECRKQIDLNIEIDNDDDHTNTTREKENEILEE